MMNDSRGDTRMPEGYVIFTVSHGRRSESRPEDVKWHCHATEWKGGVSEPTDMDRWLLVVTTQGLRELIADLDQAR